MADIAPTPVAEAPKAPTPVDALFAKKTEAKVEAKTDDATGPAKPAPVDSHAKQLALIARESKRIAADKAAIAAEKAALKAAKETNGTAAEKLAAFEAELKSHPLKALKAHGLDYTKLIEAELARQEEESNPTIRRVRELEAKIAEKEQKEIEQSLQLQRATIDRAVAGHVADIRTHIAANAEKYEFLATYKAEQEVFDKIKSEFDASCEWSDGHKGPRTEDMPAANLVKFRELTNDEACALIEQDYEDAATAMAKLKKIQNKFAPQAETKPTKTEAVAAKLAIAPAERTKSPSLSNASITAPVAHSQLSRKEREALAWAAMTAGRK